MMISWDADPEVIIEIQKVPELVQGLFPLDVGYLRHVLIFVLFDENSQNLHQ